MKFFVGIVPPLNIYEHLQKIQTKFGDNRLEPHITVRPPVSLHSIEQWVQTVKNICETIKPFDIQLPGTGFFGDRVLFVSVQSPGLNELHNQLIPALKLFEREEINKGNGDFYPHLTLGRKWCGFTGDDFTAMKQLADNYLQNGNISFKVTQVRIYYKPGNHGRFETYRDVNLSKDE